MIKERKMLSFNAFFRHVTKDDGGAFDDEGNMLHQLLRLVERCLAGHVSATNRGGNCR